jgi:hypothetical protein
MNILKSILQNMKNFNWNARAVLVGLLMLSVNTFGHFYHLNETPTEKKPVEPRAEYKSIRVDYNATEKGEKGMRIYVSFSTFEMKNVPSFLIVNFADDEGNLLRDRNGKMRNSAGNVVALRELNPQYDPADFNDLAVFMPYSELDLGNGNWDLLMDVDVTYKNGDLIQHLITKRFNYNQGKGSDRELEDEEEMETPASNVGKLNRIWIDYNVTQNGRLGMRVHVDFEVSGLKGSDIMLAVRIFGEDNEMLTSKSAAYQNESEQFEINYPLKPGFETTAYEDVSVFIPYEEIVIGKGVWNLKLDVDIEYESHELIQHLGIKEFQFKRN